MRPALNAAVYSMRHRRAALRISQTRPGCLAFVLRSAATPRVLMTAPSGTRVLFVRTSAVRGGAEGVVGRAVALGDAEAPGDAILSVLMQPELAASCGSAGRQRAGAHFDLTTQVARVASLYKGDA
jgi:glycosyltransferase involved in cell wall biosynthesis